MKKFIVIIAALFLVTAALSAQGIAEATANGTAPAAVSAVPTANLVKDVVFAKAENAALAASAADLCKDQLWKEIAASSVKADYCAKNVAVLVSDAAVVAAVQGDTYLIGILPAGSKVPEGMVELKIKL